MCKKLPFNRSYIVSLSELLRSNEDLKKKQELLKTIPGIAEVGSLYLLLATKGFTRFKNWRKFACYCGIAPFEYSSGSSIRGRNRVNPLADKKMKSLLHLLALTSIRHDPELKLYYERKKEEGKHSLLALNNVKCKLVSRIFAVIKRETPYVKTHQFANWKYLKFFLCFDIEYVIGSPFLFVCCLSVHLVPRGALAGGSFAFFVWLCVSAKMQMCHQKSWLIFRLF